MTPPKSSEATEKSDFDLFKLFSVVLRTCQGDHYQFRTFLAPHPSSVTKSGLCVQFMSLLTNHELRRFLWPFFYMDHMIFVYILDVLRTEAKAYKMSK